MEKVNFRPLGETRNIIERMELTITHIHDDIVFIEHNAFLLRFDDECENNLFLHFNEESNPADRGNVALQLEKSAEIEGFTIMKDKNYRMKQKEETEELLLEFY